MAAKQILCVEDHADTCELISLVLKDFTVISASTIAEALRKAAAQKFHTYLIDFHLPDGNGFELTSQIRTFDTETPILFVTGTSSISEAQALKSGANGLIKKTGHRFIEELRQKVRQILL
jgi:CheY-like chemotaxis protein